MTLHRRAFLKSASASCAAPLIPTYLRADTAVGAGTLTTISDGYLDLPRSFILGDLPETTAAPILEHHGLAGDMLRQPCNVTLYRDADRTVLFDTGSGSEFLPTAGDLLSGLEAAGVAADDVTDVVFTHAHPDHIWGLLDDFDDPAFPEAKYHIGQVEWDYWMNPETIDTIGEARQAFAVGAQRRLDAIEDQISTVGDGEEILPGIAAIATYGHTPGHMAFEIGGGDPVFVVGDAIGNAHLSLANPGWELGSDQDSVTAAKTRSALVQRLSKGGHRLVGFHFPGSGIGRIEPDGDAFRFVEDPA